MKINRTSLIDQTAAVIDDAIQRGIWKKWIPSEHQLCDQLGVSRGTLRSALQKLKDQSVIEAIRGKGTLILNTSRIKRKKLSNPLVCILLQETLGEIGLSTTLLIEELHSNLNKLHYEVRIVSGKKYFTKNPYMALSQLLNRERIDCWILAHSNSIVQRWFKDRDLPCVVLGASPPDIDLPRCHTDVMASSRHAAQTLVRMGHRFIILLNHQGTLKSAEEKSGFLEGAHSLGYKGIIASVLEHGHSPESINHRIKSIFRRRIRPTGLIVSHPYFYLSASSIAHEMNIRISQDLSIISMSFDSYLSYLSPNAACYDWNTSRIVKGLVNLVSKVIKREIISRRKADIIPEFVPGGSLSYGPYYESEGGLGCGGPVNNG